MLKKLLSPFTVLALTCAMILPAYAQEINAPLLDSGHLSETVWIAGDAYETKYSISSGIINYIEIEDDVFERIGNEIFMNGAKVATVETVGLSDVIEPRTGWVYTDTCPLGTASDYTKYIKDVSRNIAFEERVAYYTAKALVGIVAVALGFLNPVVGVFAEVGEAIYNDANRDPDFGDSTRAYCTETIYGHYQLSGYDRMNEFVFYKDADHTQKVTDGEATAYSWWG